MSVPTVKIYRDAVLTNLVVTVIRVSTGLYEAVFTPPQSWSVGTRVNAELTFTARGLTQTDMKFLGEITMTPDMIDATLVRSSDANDLVGAISLSATGGAGFIAPKVTLDNIAPVNAYYYRLGFLAS